MFWASIERRAVGLETPEMRQGGDFGHEKVNWEAPRPHRGNLETYTGLTASILPQIAENHHFLAVYRGGKMNPLRPTGSEAIHEYLNPSQITTQRGNPFQSLPNSYTG